ncbi:MAG: hypothetical protein Q9176_005884 [Flavoplaca citrina]
MSRITFMTAVNSVLLGIFAFCLPTYGITLLSKIKYLSLDPLDLATSARYLGRFILAVLFGLLAVWMVLHWIKPQVALLFQAHQSTNDHRPNPRHLRSRRRMIGTKLSLRQPTRRSFNRHTQMILRREATTRELELETAAISQDIKQLQQAFCYQASGFQELRHQVQLVHMEFDQQAQHSPRSYYAWQYPK